MRSQPVMCESYDDIDRDMDIAYDAECKDESVRAACRAKLLPPDAATDTLLSTTLALQAWFQSSGSNGPSPPPSPSWSPSPPDDLYDDIDREMDILYEEKCTHESSVPSRRKVCWLPTAFAPKGVFADFM